MIENANILNTNEKARINLAHEIKENMPRFSDQERAAALAIFEAGASSLGMEFGEYLEKTFPNGVFGNIKEAQLQAQKKGVEINGGVAIENNPLTNNVNALIYASESADFSTWVHELSHIWQAQLTGSLKENAEKAFQVKNSNWQESLYTFSDGHTDTSAEAFAYGFEDFLKHKAGEMASEDKKEIFEKFASYMAYTYNGINENIEINEEIANVYNAFVTLDDNVLANAQKAVEQEKSYSKEFFEKSKNETLNENQNLQFQLIGEKSILKMAESEEKTRILEDLEAAKLMEEKFKSMDLTSRVYRIKAATGWEKSADGKWKYETDDSISRIKSGSLIEKMLKSSPDMLLELSKRTPLVLGDVLEAPELFNIFPFMKDVSIKFYSDPNAFRAVLTPEGIKLNTQYLNASDGEKGLKGVLAHEIQHVIQAVEFSQSTGLQGKDIESLYNDMMGAMKAADKKLYDYDITSLKNGLDAYMKDIGEIEARNVARRITMTYDQRRHTTLESTEDVKRNIQFQTKRNLQNDNDDEKKEKIAELLYLIKKSKGLDKDLTEEKDTVPDYKKIDTDNIAVKEREAEYNSTPKQIATNYFAYNDFTFIPVRKFSEEEKQLLNSINTNIENKKLLTKKAVFYAGFLEKQKPVEEQNFEKSLKVFNRNNFLQASNSEAEIFYCKEKGTFYTANNENYLIPLELTYFFEKQEKDLFENRFSDEIKQFKTENLDFLKNIKPYTFDEDKDFELMSDISDVLSEGEVFTRTNENIDGEIKVKLGDLFDEKNPEKLQPTGLRHLIKHRMEERLNEGLSVEEAQKETTAILFLAINNIDKAPAIKEPNGRYAVYNGGIKTTIGKDKKGKYIVSGFDYIDTKEEARDSIGTVIARYGYTPGFHAIYDQVGAQLPFLNIHTKNFPVNEENLLEENELLQASEALKNIKFNSQNWEKVIHVLNEIKDISGSEKIKIPAAEEITEKIAIQENQNKETLKSLETKKEAFDFSKIEYGKTLLPPFTIMSNGTLKNIDKAVLLGYDNSLHTYLLQNGEEKLSLERRTLNELFKNKNLEETLEEEKPLSKIENTQGRAIVFADKERGINGTVIPEFSMITSHGFEDFKNCVVIKHSEADNSYTLSNGTKSLVVDKKTFAELTTEERFNKKYDENSTIYDKMLERQYEDYFKLRDNTSGNFLHNLSVYSRKKANSPCDAINIASTIVGRMNKFERDKTKVMLQSLCQKNQTINELIAETYNKAVKQFPLNEEYIKKYKKEKLIAKPFYDTISDKGAYIDNNPLLTVKDKNYNLKIGDCISNINIYKDKIFGSGKERVHYDELKIISASKEGNCITLMDKNKSFFDVPRDSILSEFAVQKTKELAVEKKQQKRSSMDISY